MCTYVSLRRPGCLLQRSGGETAHRFTEPRNTEQHYFVTRGVSDVVNLDDLEPHAA